MKGTNMIKLKLIVGGAKNVGKSSLIRRYIHGTFKTDVKATIGVDFLTKQVEIGDKKARLSIWDFGGEEKFRSLFPSYCSGASAAIILFDITNRESFNDVNNWLDLIEGSAGKIVKMLVGSKYDLVDKRVITDDEIKSFVEKKYFNLFTYSSSKTGKNVDNLFQKITRLVIATNLRECEHCKELILKDLHFCTFCGKELKN
jgi:Ras-related protein Rab-6A